MSDLSLAEATWDTIDIVAVRSVAWLSVELVSADIWNTFSDGKGPFAFVGEMLRSRRSDSSAR